MTKYSLAKRYKRNQSEAWFYPLGNENDEAAPAFKVKPFFPRGVEFARIAAEVAKPIAADIAAGTVSAQDDADFATKSFIKAALLDWRNITDEETEELIPYSPDAAFKLFKQYEELLADVRDFAMKKSSFMGDDVLENVTKN